MSTRRSLCALAVTAVATLAFGAANAVAQEQPPPGRQPIDEVPALSEYVEDVPTSSGPRATTRPKRNVAPKGQGSGGGGQSTAAEEAERSLPPAVEHKVEREGGSLARKLRTITTSARFGATKRTPKRERIRFQRQVREQDVGSAPRTTRALGTAVTAGFGGGDTRMTILLVTLLATTAAAAGAAGYRHRPGGR